MAVVNVTSANFESEVLKSDKPVIADFYADWCGPCKMLRPSLDEIADTRNDVKVVSINVDDESELAEEYDVSSIPCLVVFKNGAESDRSVGLIPKEAINDLVGGV